ncbi:tape measure protein [Virgibacillus sp. YIM 98842]|uniref:tape measure protein n=1 Tax=Virgibacillus sp. YIM 98842 TaxID=2663533 RepID=UPI0013D971FB|nr:tape measure protein [Virgibacillus sp. YIM 98842]
MAADGSIRISLEVDGKQVDIATHSLNELEATAQKAGDGAKDTEEGVKGAGNESQKASGKVKKFVSALGLIAVGAAAFQVLRRSMDDAIARFDTMDQFPRVLEGLGASADDSERAVQRLSDGIDGLPTKLDDITNTTQRMYTSFNDADKAADSALALNNALLSSSSGTEDARRGTEQYIQALQTGKMDMQSWRTLQETMNVGLVKVAESFGYAGSSATNDLYAALRDGHITMDQFNDKLIEIGTGTGELAGLARENSLGIATSFGNLRYAVARGITTVIESLDRLSKEVTGNSIAENIDGMKDIVVAAFEVIGNIIEGTAPYIKGFVGVIEATIPVVQTLSPLLIGLATAFAFHVTVTKMITAIQGANAVLKAAVASTQALTVTTKAVTAATAAQTGAVKLSTLAIGVMTGTISASVGVKALATKASYALGAAWRFLTGPIGWVTAGIGALVAGGAALIKWLNRSSAEAERLSDETEELGETTDALNDSVAQSADAYKDQQRDIQATAEANQELADRVQDLADKENKSAAEKQTLASYVNQLNDSVEGLNLSYDEQADSLNMSTGQLQARLDVMKEEENLISAQERLLELDKERNEVQMQLKEINELREEAIELFNEGEITNRNFEDSVTDLNEQEKELKGTLEELDTQFAETEEQVLVSSANMTSAIEEANLRQIQSYEDMSEEQQQTFDKMREQYEDLQETATNAFEKISTESEYSLNEMIENMEHNRKATEEWGENRAAIMEWAAEEGYVGFMKWVEQLGIDHAGELDEMAKALDGSSDEQITMLEKLAEGYDENSKAASDALKDGLGDGFDDAIGMVVDFVDEKSSTMRSEMQAAGFENIGKIAPSQMSKGIGAASGAVHSRLRTLASDMKSPFQNTSGDFSAIGTGAMSGLRGGIVSGEDDVLATARRVAGNVTNTLRSAFNINSPSRLLRDEIGQWLPKGIAVGIDENVDSIYRSLSRMSDNIMRYATPEQALGTNGMAFTGAGSQTINRQSTVNNSRSYAPQINNYFTRDESTPSEVARKNKQQQQRLAMEAGF